MSDGRPEPELDPLWHKLLELAAHEIRSPLTPLQGYLRMLLQQTAGPISDEQRRLLQQVSKQCETFPNVADELSELAALEEGTAKFNRGTLDLAAVLIGAIKTLPTDPQHPATVRLVEPTTVEIQGDAVRLKKAFGAIFHALRRELVTATELLALIAPRVEENGMVRVAIAEPLKVDALIQLERSSFVAFDEYIRGRLGLSLPIARRVLTAHGGTLLGPPDSGKSSAVILLPTTLHR